MWRYWSSLRCRLREQRTSTTHSLTEIIARAAGKVKEHWVPLSKAKVEAHCANDIAGANAKLYTESLAAELDQSDAAEDGHRMVAMLHADGSGARG